MTYTEPAYAKLNLTLDILGKRPDGYHDLRMVMVSIDLLDGVSLTPAEGNGLLVDTDLPYLPRGDGNLAAKAALRFFAETGLERPGLEISLDKRIPVCAGMAGGSSDAAAVLRILRRVYAPEMGEARLEEIGALVGSDVPYCVRGGAALAEGRGEILSDLPPLPPCPIVVCKPPCAVSTPELFGLVRVKRLRYHPRTEELIRALAAGDLEGVARRLYNVFEDVLPRKYDQVFAVKRRMLELGAMAASMTGSGPTVFGIFREDGQAQSAAEALRSEYRDVFLCHPV